MSRIRFYPVAKAKELINVLSPSGTVTSKDIVGITSDSEYQKKVVKQEIVPVSNGLVVKNYRFDEKELPIGSPINQDISKIAVGGGTASITALPNDPNEHWLAKLPDRVCNRLGCGSCSSHTLLVGSRSIACCLTSCVSGTMVAIGSNSQNP